MIITTDNLRLRDFANGDEQGINRIARAEGFEFYNLATDFESAVSFRRRCVSLANEAPRLSYKKAVLCGETSQFIGYAGFDDVDGKQSGTPDVGYFIDPRFQGSAYAAEAMIALMRYVICAHPDIRDIHATVHPENIASAKTLERLTFRQVGADIHYTDTAHGRQPRVSLQTTAQAFMNEYALPDRVIG